MQGPGYHRGRKGVAVLLNLNSVTRPLLAYLGIQVRKRYHFCNMTNVAWLCQTHFALTSAANWDKIIGTFNYDEFYWNLLEFLEGPEGEDIITLFNQYVAELLRFFHFYQCCHISHVFGLPVAQQTGNTDTGESDFDIIRLQRAAKRARLMAPPQSSTPVPTQLMTTTNTPPAEGTA